jgi:phosphoribosyl-AMP cyclohydrolase
MGIMKKIHTKMAEGENVKAPEKKFVEDTQALEDAEISLIPSYVNLDVEKGSPRVLALGFRSEAAVQKFKKTGVLYFFSWSCNFADTQHFANCRGIFVEPNYNYQAVKAGEGIIKGTIEGPYDVKGFTQEHLEHSPYRSMKEVEMGLANWGNWPQEASMPLYLWRVVKA